LLFGRAAFAKTGFAFLGSGFFTTLAFGLFAVFAGALFFPFAEGLPDVFLTGFRLVLLAIAFNFRPETIKIS